MGRRSISAGRIVAIDPGKHFFSWSLVERERITGCGLIECKLEHMIAATPLKLHEPELLVCEMPVVRPGTPRPNDLLPLAAMVGALAAALKPAELKLISPTAWKGNRTKLVDHRAIKRSLVTSELESVLHQMTGVRAALQHNVWDAVGIGLWAVHRKK